MILRRAPKRDAENSVVILEKKVAGLNEDALGRFVLRARKAVGLSGQLNVLVTSSAALRSLNLRFRRQNKATDVLSFPLTASLSGPRNAAKLAGDVAISADLALKNSFRLGHPAAQEIKILALHGILHLAGFDHERDNGEMARQEARLRRTLGLPAVLIERVTPERVRPQPAQPARDQAARRQSIERRRATTRATRVRRTA